MPKTTANRGSTIGPALGALATKECLALEHALTLNKERHSSIHEARKSSRRLRSLLAFFEPLSDDNAVAIDGQLKALARSFSALRDAYIAARTAHQFVTSGQIELSSALLNTLDEHSDVLVEEALDKDAEWHQRYTEAHRIATEIAGLPWQKIRSAAIRQVLKQHAQRTKKARKAALEKRTTSSFHRWRRRARQLRYQLEFLGALRHTKEIKKKRAQRYEVRRKKLGPIIDRLGKQQDIHVLLKLLEHFPSSVDAANLRETLSAEHDRLSIARSGKV